MASPPPSLLQYSNEPAQNTQSEEDAATASHGVPKDWKFWCIIFSLALSVLLTAVEFVSRPRSLFFFVFHFRACWGTEPYVALHFGSFFPSRFSLAFLGLPGAK